MRSRPAQLGWILLAVGFSLFSGRHQEGEEWILYGASRGEEDTRATIKEWYRLNRIRPVAITEATVQHFYDRNSLGSSSPYSGGIIRVWEKSVLQRFTKNYFEAKQDIEQQEEKRLKRKLTPLDQAWVFPLAVKNATKETHTLFEVNCDSREFSILEVNHYDKDGNRMSREPNMDRETWHAIEPGTLMEVLFQEICR